MIHDWTLIIKKLIENAHTQKDFNGDPGNYEQALYQLICELYRQPRDPDEDKIMVVLLVLHERIKRGGKSLESLASLCLMLSKHTEEDFKWD